MIIEFYAPDGAISESIINYARNGILKLHKEHKNISRADVSFRQKKRQSGLERICEINLFIAGNTITAKGICKNFDHACSKAIDALHENLVLSLKQKMHLL
ncbi:MAG TPA: HPF/RaiA family ribosome-associated protein [Flavisolibacter sp.]|jgi:ribosome-associated translation inhibitor RaiA|nr:HPF/RaiA family ribosome-associated protein [Flavisolibacter sp.]